MNLVNIFCSFIATSKDKRACFMLECTLVHSSMLKYSWCSLVQSLVVSKPLFWQFLTLFWHFFDRQTDRPTDRPTDIATYRSSFPELKNVYASLSYKWSVWDIVSFFSCDGSYIGSNVGRSVGWLVGWSVCLSVEKISKFRFSDYKTGI